jgi:beta-glucanase (GH16 family)
MVRKALRNCSVLVVLAVLLAGCSSQPPKAAHTSATAGWKRVWFDGFSGSAGSVVDSSRWSAETGGEGWGNSELEYYTAGNANASLDGRGDLALVARAGGSQYTCWYGPCRYTSSRLTTQKKFAVKYGRIDARIKVPAGSGAWPAFWMLGTDIDTDPWPGAGEIDAMETVGRTPSTTYGSLHGPGYSGANDPTASYTLPNGQQFSAGFHTFAIDWTPSSIVFLVDGHVYERQSPSKVRGHRWVFDKPFFLLLNLAVGGDFPGDPQSDAAFPAVMLVDYVAVYKRAEG